MEPEKGEVPQNRSGFNLSWPPLGAGNETLAIRRHATSWKALNVEPRKSISIWQSEMIGQRGSHENGIRQGQMCQPFTLWTISTTVTAPLVDQSICGKIYDVMSHHAINRSIITNHFELWASVVRSSHRILQVDQLLVIWTEDWAAHGLVSITKCG